MNYPVFFDSKNSLSLFGLKENFEFISKLYSKKNLPKVLMFTGNKGSGKSTIINLVGYNYAYDYAINLKKKILRNLEKHGNKANDLKNIINFILDRKY